MDEKSSNESTCNVYMKHHKHSYKSNLSAAFCLLWKTAAFLYPFASKPDKPKVSLPLPPPLSSLNILLACHWHACLWTTKIKQKKNQQKSNRRKIKQKKPNSRKKESIIQQNKNISEPMMIKESPSEMRVRQEQKACEYI